MNIEYIWTEAHEQAFQKSKEQSLKPQYLHSINQDHQSSFVQIFQPLVLEDVYGSKNEGGKFEPLMFYGRKLLPAEQHYATIEGECLAIIIGFEKARTYIFFQQLQSLLSQTTAICNLYIPVPTKEFNVGQ